MVELGIAYALSGREDEARRILDDFSALAKKKFVPVHHLALILAALGEKDEVLILLKEAYQEKRLLYAQESHCPLLL